MRVVLDRKGLSMTQACAGAGTRKSRSLGLLKEHERSVGTEELCRRHGISQQRPALPGGPVATERAPGLRAGKGCRATVRYQTTHRREYVCMSWRH